MNTKKIRPFDDIKFSKQINTILSKKTIIVFFDLIESKGTLTVGDKRSLNRSYGDVERNPLISVKLKIADENKNNINVKIEKGSSIENIAIISRYFTGLLRRLKARREDIIKHYKNVDLVLPIFSKKELIQPKPASNFRGLNMLQKMDKKLFSNNYSRLCQKRHQPIGIQGKKKVDEYLDKDENKKFIQNKDGKFKLKYSYGATSNKEVTNDNWYVCVPPLRDGFIYPYLIDTQHRGDPHRPFVPCCGKTKDKKWFAPKPEKKITTVSIMQPDKLLKKGAKGYLPLSIKEAWADNDDIYLRLGVENNTKSFLSCLCLGFNQPIANIHAKLANEINSFRTQETFGYTPSRLEEIMRNENEYVDPCLFLGIAQKAMNIQIFLYTITSQFPKGDIARPRTAFAYLPPLETFNRSMVIVIHQNLKLPRCELIIRRNEKLFDRDDPLAKTCKTILLHSSQVYRVCPSD